MAAAVIAGVAGFFAARHFFADKGEPVSGLHHSAHTGLELDFPDTGWLYLSKQDQSQSQQGVTARGVFFYRGDDPDSPEDGLALIAAKAPFPSAISDAEFDRLMGDMQQGVAQGISAQGFSVNSLDCERSSRRPGQLAECIGQGMYGDEYYDILFYFWIEGGDTLIIAAFLSKPPLDSLHGEIEAILPTIRRAP